MPIRSNFYIFRYQLNQLDLQLVEWIIDNLCLMYKYIWRSLPIKGNFHCYDTSEPRLRVLQVSVCPSVRNTYPCYNVKHVAWWVTKCASCGMLFLWRDLSICPGHWLFIMWCGHMDLLPPSHPPDSHQDRGLSSADLADVRHRPPSHPHLHPRLLRRKEWKYLHCGNGQFQYLKWWGSL